MPKPDRLTLARRRRSQSPRGILSSGKQREPAPAALTSSPDLAHWTIRRILLHHPDTAKQGFQYVDWLFDDDDLIAVCRTACDDGQGGAHSYHDANYLTFHRVLKFRAQTPEGP
jgi:hypothetical protein